MASLLVNGVEIPADSFTVESSFGSGLRVTVELRDSFQTITVEDAVREEQHACADLVSHPYDPGMGVCEDDSPSAVGRKIAAAILNRSLS